MGLTADDRRFLTETRLGFLTTTAAGDEWPATVPVWFECGGQDEQSVQLFSVASSPKVRRIRAAGRASLVAGNHVGEPEHWVAVAGPARVETDGAFELAERLAARYWDMTDPDHAAALDAWRSAPLVRIVIDAETVTRHA